MKGIYTQLYRGASGFSEGLDAWLSTARTLGVTGMIMHGFLHELDAEKYKRLHDRTKDAGYECGVSFGLGDVGARAKSAGKWMADVAKHADFCVLDMEGKWEDDAEDPQKAREMCEEFRSHCPDTVLIDQPPSRPIPHHHSSILWRSMCEFTDFRAPQWYWNNLRGPVGEKPGNLGPNAYERIRPDFEADWNVWVIANTPKPLVPDPLIPTVQGYHWQDWTLVDWLHRQPTTIMWCENHRCDTEKTRGPFPTQQTQDGMQDALMLREMGLDSRKAIADWQKAHGLSPDGRFGKLTKEAMRVALYT